MTQILQIITNNYLSNLLYLRTVRAHFPHTRLQDSEPTGNRLESATASLLVPVCGKCNEWPISVIRVPL